MEKYTFPFSSWTERTVIKIYLQSFDIFYSTIVWEIARGTWIFVVLVSLLSSRISHKCGKKRRRRALVENLFFFLLFSFLHFENGRECIPYICFVSTEYLHVMVILRLRLSWLWCDGNIKRTWFVSVQRLTFIKERHQRRLYCAGIKKIFVLCPVLWMVFYILFQFCIFRCFSTTFF